MTYQTGKFAKCAPEIKISRKFCAPRSQICTAGKKVLRARFNFVISTLTTVLIFKIMFTSACKIDGSYKTYYTEADPNV